MEIRIDCSRNYQTMVQDNVQMVQMVTAILVDDEELRKKKAKNVTKVL